ncbi:MAG: hypothetical protein QM734_00865 [Cyclobacteriaceae bacterium]
MKALIYAGIDTTSSEKFKALDANPFPTAKEAFLKAEEIDKGKNESLVNGIYPARNYQILCFENKCLVNIGLKNI